MDSILTEYLIKLGMAVLVGGLVGAEREFHDKAAGFRTIILITVGSALFTIFSISMDPENRPHAHCREYCHEHRLSGRRRYRS